MLNLRFLENNHPRTLILLHGFLGDQHIWDPLLPLLSKHFNLITLDLPGHGKSLCKEDTLTMEHIANLVISELDNINIDHFHVVGHSMGGYVGLEIMSKIPHRIKSLTLLNSTAKDDTPQKREDRLRAVRVFDLSPKVYIKEAINNLFYEPNIKRLEPEVSRLQEIALNTSVGGAQACLRGMRDRKNFVDLINTTKIPIQYISGVHDSTVTYDSITEQIKSKDILLTTMNDSGHMSFAEEKEKCERAIINFVENI